MWFGKQMTRSHLSDGDGLLLHGLVDSHSVVLSHLKNKSFVFNTEGHE